MNEIEKLQEDFKTFVWMGKYHNEPLIENENSQQCALITINKVLEVLGRIKPGDIKYDSTLLLEYDYWQETKKNLLKDDYDDKYKKIWLNIQTHKKYCLPCLLFKN